MTRQKSDGRVVPQSRRKPVSTHVEQRGGGKATTVEQQGEQLALLLGTAEEAKAQARAADGEAARGVPRAVSRAVPKPRSTKGTTHPVTMEAVAQGLWSAFQKVAANRGAAGPDRQSIEQVRAHLDVILSKLAQSLLDGTYRPGEIRRVWIPKAGGGERGLGIPNVVERVVQESVRGVLEPEYEPTFHEGSHGFRPGRSCRTAIELGKKQVEDGHEWVVDLDLEKFFDRVNHQRLMARLAERVSDRRILVLIQRMLKAKVVMPDGVVMNTDEGVPQGGPLSPLLSNIVLDELDRELDRRGHRFVRYADDCNIYVRSQRAGERVMASIVRFIESRLRLKVNAAKSAVARPEERHFLGFCLGVDPERESVEVLLSKRSQERLAARIRDLTPRPFGNRLQVCIEAINTYVVGWIGFFGICTEGALRVLQSTDAHIRRRLRAILLKQWKTSHTIVRRLTKLGVKPLTARRSVNGGRKHPWALSHSSAVDRGLRNAYFAGLGLVSMEERWRHHPARLIVAPARQIALGLG